MEEELPSSLKRQREEEEEEDDDEERGKFVGGEVEEISKKQKSIRDIISILEEDEDEPNEDISSLITTLQQEISPSSSLSESSASDCLITMAAAASATAMTAEINSSLTVPAPPALDHSSSFSSKDFEEEDQEEGREGENVMRHLLEASDDELGIPSTSDVVGSGSGGEEGRIEKDELLIGHGDVLTDGGCGGGHLLDLGVGGGMWEFEDETANYYAMLQSELFLEAGV